LIEVLMALVIIALAVSALLGGLITAISTSGEQRSLSVEDTLLRSNAESIKYQLEFQTASPFTFKECATQADYQVLISESAEDIVAGYRVTVQPVDFWIRLKSNFETGEHCSSLQLLTLIATRHGASPQSLSFVVRNPQYAPTE
jgi:hypothetical protein